jgi:membrane-associated protease RseP (regulator of RpoE activity)
VSEEPRFRIDAPPPARRRSGWTEHPLFHLALLVATFVSTTIAGGSFSPTGGIFGKHGHFADGLPFSIPLLTILGVHEMGHWAMCRRYGVSATLPYFLPLPLLGFAGTLGAVIRIKEPIRSRRQLIDIGAAGPIAGFLTSIPFLLYGVSRATAIPPSAAGSEESIYFGYPILVRIAQDITHTPRYTSMGVHEDPTFMAAWFGLLVTALNLMPIGQLDGGHVLRATVGRKQPYVSLAVLGLVVLLTVAGGWQWAIFAAVVSLFVGVAHPPADDEDVPLDDGRQFLALLCVAIFLLCFTIAPVWQS